MPEVVVLLDSPWISRNQFDRMHHGARGGLRARLRSRLVNVRDIFGLTHSFHECEVEAVRYSAGKLDLDNLTGGLKALLDCFVERSPRNPWGSGLIFDDRASLLHRLDVDQERVPENQARSVIKIRGALGPPLGE